MEKEQWWKQLQPLRIPPGWKSLWNKLDVREPEELSAEDPAWMFTYVQDMTLLRREAQGQTLDVDLGWYPDGDPEGAYGLTAVLDGNWLDPILEYSTRSTKEVVETLEYWLFACFPASGQVDEKSFRKRHPNKR